MPLSIIGAGLGRTGTMSLKLAIEKLGLGPCYHMYEVFQNPAAPGQWEAVGDGQGPPWEEIFKGFNATVDWPSATYYKELAAAYPDAKVILTRRDPEAWWRSTQATIFAGERMVNPQSQFERMVAKTVGVMFDRRMHDHDHGLAVYERHNAEVLEVIPRERLLVYEVADGWGPLCQFLGVAEPEGPMIKTNTTEEFQSRLAGVREAQAAAEPATS